MKIVLGVLGAFALVVCISLTDAAESELNLPLNLMDLPVELRLDILEQIDFIDLIHIGKALPHQRNLIATVFRAMLKNRRFQVIYNDHTDKFVIGYEDAPILNITRENANENCAEILEFFQYFGDCISRLDLSLDPINNGICDALPNQIGDYVAESVNEIRFIYNYYKNYTSITIPFPNAKIVDIRYGTFDAETLHQMLPTVHSLGLESTQPNESLSNFPQLERLTIPYVWGYRAENLGLFEKTLEMNPQLKHLSIPVCTLILVKALNRIQSDLESLTILSLGYGGHDTVTQPLRFANMKVFRCTSYTGIDQFITGIPFEFGNLEEIELNIKFHFEYWVNIAMQNKNLRKFSTPNVLRREHLERIANELPNLEESSMEYDNTDPQFVQNVVHFLQSVKQLRKATFLKMETDQCKAAAEQLNNDWEYADLDPCTFIRTEF